jgi:Protein of unknown function (DUF2637)
MSDYSADRGARTEQSSSGLRLAALAAVVAGVVLLAAAAFVFSYSGIHQIARNSGVTPGLARVYPLIFDAMLVIAGAAVLALRGAGWWTRSYVWFCLLLLLTGVAAGDAVRAMHVSLPSKPSRAAVAVTPWVLVLLAFGMWLAMLRHLRRIRSAMPARRRAAGQAVPASRGRAIEATAAERTDGPEPAEITGITWTSGSGAGSPRRLPPPQTGLDNLLDKGGAGTQPPERQAGANTIGKKPATHAADPTTAASGPATDAGGRATPAGPAAAGQAAPAGQATPAGPAAPGQAAAAAGQPAAADDATSPAAEGAVPAPQPAPTEASPTAALPVTAAAERAPPGQAAVHSDEEDAVAGQPAAAPPEDAEPGERPPPPPFDRMRSTPTPPED